MGAKRRLRPGHARRNRHGVGMGVEEQRFARLRAFNATNHAAIFVHPNLVETQRLHLGLHPLRGRLLLAAQALAPDKGLGELDEVFDIHHSFLTV